MDDERCMFCLRGPAPVRATAEETGSDEARACDSCWKLMKDPRTALPLMRGHLTLTLRGSGDPELEERIQSFMDIVKDFRPKS
jgi:hypothetical protein